MKVNRIIIISLIIIVFANQTFRNFSKEKNKSFKRCLLMKKKAPYLKLDCEKIMENIITFEKEFISLNLKKDNKFIQKVKTINYDDIKKVSKKIHFHDEIKLKNLIKELKN
jgi:hypothetical protein